MKIPKNNLQRFGMRFGNLNSWVILLDELKEKSLECWVVINCNGDFVEAYPGEKHEEVKAKVLVEELDSNFGKKGAYYTKARIILDKLT